MSKTYGMAGWRIAFVLGNPEIVERLNVIGDHSRVGHGYSPRLDLEQAEADYQATAQIVPQVQQAIAQEEDALSVLTGAPWATPDWLAATLGWGYRHGRRREPAISSPQWQPGMSSNGGQESARPAHPGDAAGS